MKNEVLPEFQSYLRYRPLVKKSISKFVSNGKKILNFYTSLDFRSKDCGNDKLKQYSVSGTK